MSRAERWMHRWAMFTAASTAFLVFAGGMVTSTGSGLAVPDWPLSYGSLFPPMVGGVFYEHGHRLVAAFVALLTAGLALAAWRWESRAWVRRLALGALLLVVLQALLGGLTVLFLLPTAISVAHAGVANLFFCLTVCMAVLTARAHRQRRRAPLPTPGKGLRTAWVGFGAAVYGQILLGAWMRHTGAGLAIPDFPLAFGRLVPPLESSPVALHFAHRVGAVLLTLLASAVAGVTLRRTATCAAIRWPTLLLVVVLLPAQWVLGAFTVWTAKAAVVTSLHVLVGTLILGTAVWTGLEVWRRTPSPRRALVPPAPTAVRQEPA